MIKRTWAYGTKLAVEVLVSSPKAIFVRHEDENKWGESFVLLGHGIKELPTVGSAGFITFERGGPTGGYWKWTTT